MAAVLQPPELAALVDTAERPRTQDWSLHAALTRYGQPEPERTSAVIELLRRIEHAIKPHLKRLETDGPDVWAAITGGTPTDDRLVALLRALRELDRLGDVLATWAVERAGERPDTAVDAVVADASTRLNELGVAREERPRPTAGRG